MCTKLVIEENADALLCVSAEGLLKEIGGVKLVDDNNDIVVTLSSISDNGKHEMLDKFLGHKVRFTVEIVDD